MTTYRCCRSASYTGRSRDGAASAEVRGRLMRRLAIRRTDPQQQQQQITWCLPRGNVDVESKWRVMRFSRYDDQ